VARSRKPDVTFSDCRRIEKFAAPAPQEEGYARQQMAHSVRAAVSALPPKFRIAVLLRYFEDLSYEEKAEALGCSPGTVASRLSRSHKMLAERLKGVTGKEN